MTEKNEKPSIEQQVAEWSAERAGIATLVATAEGVTVAGHADGPKAGREKVHDTLMPIWRRRCAIDNREKELLEIPKQITKRIKDVAAELSAPLLAVENRLRADRDAYDAEQARIAQEAADAKRRIVEDRLAVMAKFGIAPNLSLVDGATPEEWSAKVAEWEVAAEAAWKAEAIAKEAERVRLEAEAAEAARKAEEERIERERLEAERKAEADRLEAEREAERTKERAERERMEKAAQRMRELATVGSLLTLDECAAMDDVIFAAALASATAVHAEAQRKADEIRQENARLQREAEARAEADRIEAQRKEREAQEEAARIKREADEAEAKRKAEEAKPSLDKAHAWLDAVLAAVAAVPPVEDASVRRDLARCAELLRGVIAEERGNFAPF